MIADIQRLMDGRIIHRLMEMVRPLLPDRLYEAHILTDGQVVSGVGNGWVRRWHPTSWVPEWSFRLGLPRERRSRRSSNAVKPVEPEDPEDGFPHVVETAVKRFLDDVDGDVYVDGRLVEINV